jgi:hypothetical protein
MDNTELLRELDTFLAEYGIADSTFGVRAVGDSHLVRRIRDGRPIRRSTVLRVRQFMDSHRLAVLSA